MPRISSGRRLANCGLHRHGPGEAQGLVGHPAGEDLRDLLVGPVLQEPGEQQVAGLQQGEVLLVLDLAGGQQPGRLEVEQGRRDEQEVARLVEVPLRAPGPDVGDELVGDLVSETSVMSSLCLEISPSSRSKGPSKTSRCTLKVSSVGLPVCSVIPPLSRRRDRRSPLHRVPPGENFAGQLAVGVGAHGGGVELGDGLTGDGGVGEADRAVDDRVEDLLAERLRSSGPAPRGACRVRGSYMVASRPSIASSC